MAELLIQIITPSVVAALVTGLALVARELVTARGKARGARLASLAAAARRADEIGARHDAGLLRQVQLLWSENADLKERESECEARYRALEQRCLGLERQCDRLRRRIDGLGRLVTGPRRDRSRRNSHQTSA